MERNHSTGGGDTGDDSPELVFQLTIAANQIVGADPGTNAYDVRNAHLIDEKKKRVRYKNGMTLPCSAQKLVADAERKVRHSRTLARNIKNQTGVLKPAQADAHHIVAQSDRRASGSRDRLFKWGIGINDADNGVYLPKRVGSMPNSPDATAHEGIHTARYHLTVFARLLSIDDDQVAPARAELRDMRDDMLAGIFPY
ncbi:MAG: AHH domain-containing protein [Rhodanobacter sp.]